MPSRPKQFSAQRLRTQQHAEAEYDARRGTARQRGYGPRWEKSSAGFKRAHPLCLGCKAVDRIRATEVTDHVIPHKGDMVLFWDRSKWQPSCAWHHNVVKQILERMHGKGEIGTDQLWLNSSTAVRLTLDLDP